MSDKDEKVVRPFFRNSTYDEMSDELEGVLDKYAGMGISRCEVVGCLEFIKKRVMKDE